MNSSYEQINNPFEGHVPPDSCTLLSRFVPGKLYKFKYCYPLYYMSNQTFVKATKNVYSPDECFRETQLEGTDCTMFCYLGIATIPKKSGETIFCGTFLYNSQKIYIRGGDLRTYMILTPSDENV